MAAEAKAVLDSWVRYESQVKQRQQKELAENIINKINKELENPKTLNQILQQSVADVERKYILLNILFFPLSFPLHFCFSSPWGLDPGDSGEFGTDLIVVLIIRILVG